MATDLHWQFWWGDFDDVRLDGTYSMEFATLQQAIDDAVDTLVEGDRFFTIEAVSGDIDTDDPDERIIFTHSRGRQCWLVTDDGAIEAGED
jgi:PIN domain nuclease of toxin-antitoxin system